MNAVLPMKPSYTSPTKLLDTEENQIGEESDPGVTQERYMKYTVKIHKPYGMYWKAIT